MKSEVQRRAAFGWRWLVIHLASNIPLESAFYCTVFAIICAFLAIWSHDIWRRSIPAFTAVLPEGIFWCKVAVRIAQVCLAFGAAKFLARMLQICYRKYYNRAQLRFS
jgi:hypothetical protein